MTIEFPLETNHGEKVRFSTDSQGRVTGFINPATVNDTYLAWDDLRFPAQGINPAGQTDAPSIDTTTFPGTLLFDPASINLIAGVAPGRPVQPFARMCIGRKALQPPAASSGNGATRSPMLPEPSAPIRHGYPPPTRCRIPTPQPNMRSPHSRKSA